MDTSVRITQQLSGRIGTIATRHRLTKEQVIDLAVRRLAAIPVQERSQIVDQFTSKESESCGTTGTRPSSTKEPSTGSSKTSARARQQPKT